MCSVPTASWLSANQVITVIKHLLRTPSLECAAFFCSYKSCSDNFSSFVFLLGLFCL